MTDRLQDKVAIVTGGGTGIGKATAVIFAREGAKVVVCGRTPKTIAETARQVHKEGGDIVALECDVSDSGSVRTMVAETVKQFGQVDILVNNAGVRGTICTVLELSEEEWQRTIDIDAKGAWLCSKYVIPEMQRVGGGSIIMISSVSAHVGQRKHGVYNAAKAAQELLMKCMALDYAPDKIRANSICPGWVITEMNREQMREMQAQPDKVFASGLNYSDIVKLHPLGRIGAPEDVAWAAVFLASEESNWVTGTSLFVDGGYTCQ